MVKHTEVPPAEKRSAPHKNQNEYANSLMDLLSTLGHGVGRQRPGIRQPLPAATLLS